ncbi:MAG TPA: DUF3060 domain-containing protein [Pyrinomonadaceae bacterium]|nr:DUF3060 domain-containing protein [Pyrinomonadaceae bacterium]
MRNLFISLSCFLLLAACDVQSGISRKSVEPYQPTPTPSPVATIEEEPIDPADVVQIDTSLEGRAISIDKPAAKITVDCKSYDRVAINTDGQKINITGACQQLMVNGKGNEVTVAAASVILVNGDENVVSYSKFIYARRPTVTDNGDGNTIEQSSAPTS